MITKLAIKKINLMYVQVKYNGQRGDEKRSHNHWCWVTLQELLLDNTGKEKKQSCLSTEDDVSNSRRRDDWSVLSVKCVFLTCYDDIVTHPLLFFLLRRWDFFPRLLPPAASASLRDDIHHFCSMRFISSGLFTDFYCSVAIFKV